MGELEEEKGYLFTTSVEISTSYQFRLIRGSIGNKFHVCQCAT